MNIQWQRIKGCMLISLAGDLNVQGVEQLKQALATKLPPSEYPKLRAVVFDFSHVSHLEPAGLGLLLSLWKELNPHGVKVALACLQGEQDKVVRLAHLHRLTPLYRSPMAAVAALGEQPQPTEASSTQEPREITSNIPDLPDIP